MKRDNQCCIFLPFVEWDLYAAAASKLYIKNLEEIIKQYQDQRLEKIVLIEYERTLNTKSGEKEGGTKSNGPESYGIGFFTIRGRAS